jgi:Protein of unknown function (DUF1631)
MTTHSNSIIFQCIRVAVVSSHPMMLDLLGNAVAAMRARQTVETELLVRMSLAESADVLSRQCELLADQFSDALEKSLNDALQADAAMATKPLAAASLRFDQLELMDDDQVQGRIDLARMQQSAALHCEHELAELDALVCAARGFSVVQVDRNPFRPQVYAAAIADLMMKSASSPDQRMQWMQHMGSTLGMRLRNAYRELIDFLQSLQVESAAYTVSNSRSHNVAAMSVERVTFEVEERKSGSTRERTNTSRLTVDQLRHALGAESHRPTSLQDADGHFLYEDFIQDIDEISTLVTQVNARNAHKNAHNAHNPSVSDASPDSELHTSRAQAISVREDALDESEAVAQDVVRMMLDNLRDDHRLLPCVRDWVGSLEPPLVALAIVDVRFLNDKSHSARKFLDEVTARSLGYSAQTADGFAEFFSPVVQSTAVLMECHFPDAQAFDLAWHTVEFAWSRHKSSAQQHREHAVQALLQAEQRNILAEKIALELTRRDDARLAPIFVKQFVAGPWSQVIATARLSPVLSNDAQSYVDVVTDLLWSVVVEQASRNKARLARMVPGLLSQLRAGLVTISSPEQEGAAFFAQLMKLHEQALKSALPLRKPEPASASKLLPDQSTDGTSDALGKMRTSHEDGAVWLAPQEVRDSGFMSDFGDDAYDTAPPSTLPDTLPQDMALFEEFLTKTPPTLGSWVELLSQSQWIRAQLTWASPHGTLFMFTGVAGKPYSMTRRALDKMQALQTLRIISQDSLVAGALNAVAQTALRNTINSAID